MGGIRMEHIFSRERLEEHVDFAREINVERDKGVTLL